jgi:hypothetical protein
MDQDNNSPDTTKDEGGEVAAINNIHGSMLTTEPTAGQAVTTSADNLPADENSLFDKALID